MHLAAFCGGCALSSRMKLLLLLCGGSCLPQWIGVRALGKALLSSWVARRIAKGIQGLCRARLSASCRLGGKDAPWSLCINMAFPKHEQTYKSGEVKRFCRPVRPQIINLIFEKGDPSVCIFLDRWTLIVPSGWAMAFWVPLIYAGAHAIGQRERHWVATEVSSFTVGLYRLLEVTWHLVYSSACWSVVGWYCQRESRLCNQECSQRSCWPRLDSWPPRCIESHLVRTSALTSLQTSIVRRLAFLLR